MPKLHEFISECLCFFLNVHIIKMLHCIIVYVYCIAKATTKQAVVGNIYHILICD